MAIAHENLHGRYDDGAAVREQHERACLMRELAAAEDVLHLLVCGRRPPWRWTRRRFTGPCGLLRRFRPAASPPPAVDGDCPF